MVEFVTSNFLVDQIGDGIERKLQNYIKVAYNKKPSRMKVALNIKAVPSSNIEEMWKEHQRIISNFNMTYSDATWTLTKKPKFSLVDLKIKILEKIFSSCVLCEHECGINRKIENGYCGVKKSLISSEFIHMGEEAVLVPSHTIFFSGCNLKCVYCQNWDISQNPSMGLDIPPEKLAKIIDLRREQGSLNVNFVGGDPTPHLKYIFTVMKNSRENIPIVWNSNMYLTEDAMNLLQCFVDLYLTDYKYGNDACAEKLSGISNYSEVVRRNHKIANGSGDMIIRHLILPNHVDCCSKPVLKWIADHLGNDVVLNIMPQYRPAYKSSEYRDLNVLPTREEVQEVILYAEALGFVNLI